MESERKAREATGQLSPVTSLNFNACHELSIMQYGRNETKCVSQLIARLLQQMTPGLVVVPAQVSLRNCTLDAARSIIYVSAFETGWRRLQYSARAGRYAKAKTMHEV